MTREDLEPFRERYRFDEWQGTSKLDQEIEVHGLAQPEALISGLKEIAGLDADRVRVIELDDETRLFRASWQAKEKAEALILLDIRECPSRAAAHEVVLELLANMQSPHAQRLDEKTALGDVAFAHESDGKAGSDGHAALVFARCNLAVRISNGGPEIMPVDAIARDIDRWIVERGSSRIAGAS